MSRNGRGHFPPAERLFPIGRRKPLIGDTPDQVYRLDRGLALTMVHREHATKCRFAGGKRRNGGSATIIRGWSRSGFPYCVMQIDPPKRSDHMDRKNRKIHVRSSLSAFAQLGRRHRARRFVRKVL
jgi:hypothetical protein